MLQLDQITKSYGAHKVVDDVSLTVRGAEKVAVIGHNGAGKTTLFKILLGLVKASSGSIRSQAQQIGFLPETVAFSSEMTGAELLAFYARLKSVPVRHCTALLEEVGLASAAERRVKTYSKGMRQRLGLAQALLGDPQLLILDEPTTGLDPFLRKQFYDILQRCKQGGAAVLLSSHALSEIEGHADHLVVMKQGRVLVQGTLEELRAQANLPITLRLSVPAGEEQTIAGKLNGAAQSITLNSGAIELRCQAKDKMFVMQQLVQGASVEDVHIIPPRLDDLYRYFVGQSEAP